MELTELIERSDAEFVWELGSSSGPGPALLGTTRHRFGSVAVLAAPRDTLSFWSRAAGFGLDRPVDSVVIGEVLDYLRDAGCTTANLSIAPQLQPPDWDAICVEHSLTAGPTSMRLTRPAEPVKPAATELRVGTIESSDADAWAQLQLDVFEMDDENFRSMLVAYTDWPGVTAYGTWDGDTLVGTASLHVVAGVGRFLNGATRPEYRGRGGQSALVAQRIADAFEQGCAWVTSDTAKPEPGGHNSSLSNLERAGFTVLAERAHAVWALPVS
ncbi:GNAT family N-acetyltransferase [Kribbella antibiotica]|uniref:GNAT family N-acetyltransferase n=1 Tax=Kribbella antibiotica TaxID=190195 RepID=A0A4R4ZLY3_9ACTN|nr:GNAT family N-acetyltransferase [Kribbella antibiotica]TDD58659.1 GNAT family N-acetyltransferase [Kribbella antibiotica]